MGHRGEVDHERSGAKIIDRGLFNLRAYSQYRVLERSNAKLSTDLTERDQPNAGDYQIGNVILQVGG
jgi:hypothetical protein